jgi:1A family penicillin-binding protein
VAEVPSGRLPNRETGNLGSVSYSLLPTPPRTGGGPATRGITRAAAWTGTLVGGALSVFLVLVLTAGVLTVPAADYATAAIEHFQGRVPDDPTLGALGERSLVVASDGSVLAVLHDEVNRKVVGLDTVPDHVRQAVLTAEDRRFYDHDGYDLEGIFRAAWVNLQQRSVVQGGSTITQQLAKQNFTGAEQTIDRKISELLYALSLEDQFSKDELLERYLNEVYFGAGAYGIAAAAEEFFGRDPADLTVAQAALLAGLIRAPGSLDPRQNPDAALTRRNQILAGMVTEGYLDHRGATRWAATPLGVLPRRQRPVTEPYVVEAVKREFFANPAFGGTRADRIDRLFSGGLIIHTTIDPRLQATADDIVTAAFPDASGPTAAIAAVDPRLGRVLALHAGADFAEEQFDLATQGRRQPGSAFKTFVLAAALQAGFPLELQLQASSPMQFTQPGWNETWTVRNYGNASYGGTDLSNALVRSINTAFAQLVLAVGVDGVTDLVERLGIPAQRALGTDYGPAIALGGLQHGVTPLEMAAAYGTFANRGIHVTPYLIDRVGDRHGNIVFERSPDTIQAVQAVESAVAAAMTDVMTDVIRAGTGRGARLARWPAAGKTGTTQNHADAWFIGYTPVLSTAVWVGHPQGQISMARMTGGSLPAQLWQRFMTDAHDGLEPIPFPTADGDLRAIQAAYQVEIPDVRGMPEAAALGALTGARLVAVIHQVASATPAGTVVWQQPPPGSVVSAGTSVTLGVSTGRPPPPPPPPEASEAQPEQGDDTASDGPSDDGGPPPDDGPPHGPGNPGGGDD